MTRARALLAAFALATLGACVGASPPVRPPDALFAGPEIAPPLAIRWVHQMDPEARDIQYGPLEGAGVATDGARAYVGSSAGVFYALDLATGKVVWAFRTYGPIHSTALVWQDRVLFGDSDGMIYALRASDGTPFWEYQVRGEVLSAPAVEGGVAFFTSSAGNVTALDATTGAWIWMFERPLPKGFTIRGTGSPVVHDGVVFVGFPDGYLVAIDAAEGKERWKNNLLETGRFRDVDSTPVIEGDRLYLAGYDGAFYCVSVENGAILWRFAKGGTGRPALADGLAFFGGTDGAFFALDAMTGEERWSIDVARQDLPDRLVPIKQPHLAAPPVVADEHVVFGSAAGDLYFVRRASGQVAWHFQPGTGVASQPVIAGGCLLFVTNAGNLYCMDSAKTPAW